MVVSFHKFERLEIEELKSANEVLQSKSEYATVSSCPSSDLMRLEDVILPESITHANTTIPRVIHFIVRDRCVPLDITKNLNEWKKLSEYSIVFHDQHDVDEYLSTERTDLPFIPNAARCAVESIVKSDLVKFLLLWDFGGFVVSTRILGDGNTRS